MTTRWKVGKEPTIEDIKYILSNSINTFLNLDDLEKMAKAVYQFYRDRKSGKK